MMDGDGEDGDGAGLMGEAKLDGHGEKQRPNAERRLEHGKQSERQGAPDQRRR